MKQVWGNPDKCRIWVMGLWWIYYFLLLLYILKIFIIKHVSIALVWGNLQLSLMLLLSKNCRLIKT